MSEVLFGRGGHIEALRDPEGLERWEVAEMDLTSNTARWASYSEWASWNEEALNANFREWRRIPLQLAQPEAETMTQQALAAAVVELEQVRKQLASALGSQKAAAAALETERNKKNHYRHALEIVGQRIQTALNETAGKESGG